jgi:hypothetical protein
MSLARWRLRALEAMAALFVVTAIRRCIPMHLWAPRLIGRANVAPLPVVPSDAVLTDVDRQVAGAVHAATRRAPVQFTCLDEAVAGALMLRRRRVAASVVVGLPRDEALTDSHAWLLGACDGIVLGGMAADRYVPASVFSRA